MMMDDDGDDDNVDDTWLMSMDGEIWLMMMETDANHDGWQW